MPWKSEGTVGINYKHLNTDLPSWKLLEASKQPIGWAFWAVTNLVDSTSVKAISHMLSGQQGEIGSYFTICLHTPGQVPSMSTLGSLLFIGNVFHDAQWVPETVSMPDPIQTG